MNNLVAQFMAVWLHPWAAMNQVKTQGENADVKSSMLFIIAMGLISGLITAVAGMIFPDPAAGSKWVIWLSVLIVPLVSFLGSFIGALIIWGLVDGFLRGTASQYWLSYRLLALLAAFSPVSAILTRIPQVGEYLAIAVNVWATIVMIRGIIIVRNTPPVRTWVTCGVLFAFLFALGIFARIAAQREFQANGGFSDFGATGTDLGTDEGATAPDDLDKQLQDLAEKAQSGETKK